MAAFAILLLLLPVLLIAVALGGAWYEGRRSPYAFGIGRVISNTFGAIGGAPLALFGASALLNAPMQLAMPLIAGRPANADQLIAIGTSLAPFGILWILVYPFLKLFMTGIAVDTLAGQPVDPGATSRMALRRTLPALGMLILFGIALMMGMVLFLVPALILWLTWFVVVPVMAAEGRGAIECFGRSQELLRGMRWRLLVLLAIGGVLYIVATGMVQGLVLGLLGTDNMWLSAGIQAVFATLVGVLPATAAAAVYHEARTAKEGSGSHDLEAVFA